jgi:sigma-B regulation protein RsbU (phosphoserine phosphatase)
MGDQLKQSLAEAREKDRLQYELQIAREVQLSLLPRSIPQIPGFQVAAKLETANEVGGDFYDLISLNESRYLFTIGDVSGKGSSAALYMAQCMSLIRYTRQFTSDPDKICSRLNDYFASTITDRQIFVTIIVGIIDAQAKTVQFVRAGHAEPLILVGNNGEKCNFVHSSGLGVGLTKNGTLFESMLQVTEISLNQNDTLIMYTDGVTEATRHDKQNGEQSGNDDFDMYGEERLKMFLNQHYAKGAHEIANALESDIDTFYGTQPRVDDYTILVIQCND